MADIHEKEIDQISGVETTGHEWDGLKELNNPLPRWWLYSFYACIVWAIGYWVIYPSWPLISSYTTGVMQDSQRANALAAYDAGIAARADTGEELVATSFDDIRTSQPLLEFAMANGKAAFGDNCAPCHGSGALGSAGYPNLQDDNWIWGGTMDDIHTTLLYGIRSDHDDARIGEMPAFGTDELLTREEINQVANFVASKVGLEAEKDVDLAAGEMLYVDNCAACHGDDLAGVQEMGGPSLTTANYLYAKSLDGIKAQIQSPRNGVMPAWDTRLDPAAVKSLAVYVHSFGGGQ